MLEIIKYQLQMYNNYMYRLPQILCIREYLW